MTSRILNYFMCEIKLRIHRSYATKKMTRFKKWAKDLNRHSPKADTEISSRHSKHFSLSLTITLYSRGWLIKIHTIKEEIRTILV